MALDSPQAGPTWVLVPLKRTVDAKQRLADLLDPDARRRLVLAMFEDVLAGAHGSGGAGRGSRASSW